MNKLQRSYFLRVQRNDGLFQEFELPYTIEFDVNRNNYSTPNSASIKIYNLSPDSRNAIRKDILDTDVSRRVTLKVGYGETMSTIFDGTLNQCWSARQGVNFITHLDCRDNGYLYNNGEVSVQYSAGESVKSVVEKIVKQMKPYGVDKGIIGDIQGTFYRDGSVKGLAVDLLRTITGDIAYIDNNKIFCLNDGEGIETEYQEITSDTGLLDTPILENAFVRCNLLLEPRLIINQKIKLNSTTASNGYNYVGSTSYGEIQTKGLSTYHYAVTNFNGDYKITGIRHSGVISQTVSGSAVTSVVLSGEYIKTAYKGFSIGS